MLSINAPLNILTGLSLFCFIMSFDFNNRLINALAPGSFTAYLIQEGPYVGSKVLYPRLKNYVKETIKYPPNTVSGGASTVTVIFLFSVIFIFSVLLFDWVRRKIFGLVLEPLFILVDKVQKKLFEDEHEKTLP